MLEPIRIIIQDFPKYISEFADFKGFAIRQRALGKLRILVRNATSTLFAITSEIKAKLVMRISPKLAWAINANAKAKMAIYTTFTSKIGFSPYFIDHLVKMGIKASFKTQFGMDVKYIDELVHVYIKTKANSEFGIKFNLDESRIMWAILLNFNHATGFFADILDDFIKIRQNLRFNNIIGIGVGINKGSAKVLTKATMKTKITAIKISADAVVGKVLRLGDWDPQKLGDMDDITMSEVSLEEYKG